MGITEARTYLVCQSFYFKAKSVDKFKPVGGEKSDNCSLKWIQ